ncbi:MAG: hypothetical protein WBD40_13605, partial [Tepidisphaeraceae bacterium]
MADEPQVIRGINWRDTFPFTNLFRAFRVAVHPSKLVLGLILLLGIYAGGRFLDGIWPARHLAVPGEVDAYEEMRNTGKTSADFLAQRRTAREAIEAEYADRLLQEQVVTQREDALNEAREGDKLGALKDKIVKRRDDAAAAAAKARDEALAKVKSLPEKERDAA